MKYEEAKANKINVSDGLYSVIYSVIIPSPFHFVPSP